MSEANEQETKLLSHDDAQVLVDRVTVAVGRYRGVPQAEVSRLLGERASLLRSDPIRKLGPSPEFVYPWNVVDYLCHNLQRTAKL